MSPLPQAWCLICGMDLNAGHTCQPLRECRECRQGFRVAPFEGLAVAQRMAEDNLCFACHRWTNAAAAAQSPDSVRIAGFHYTLGPEQLPPGAPRGMDGRRFFLRFEDGRLVESTNLWGQGPVPPHFQSRLPDNATWAEAPW